MPLAMFDSIDPSQIPSNPPAVAGYVGGSWPDYSRLVARFPKAHHLSIAVNASEDADCLDVENGDAVPSEAPAWVKRQKARGIERPVVYSSVSQMPGILEELKKAGLKRTDFRVWSAHYTDTPHIESGSDATQWTNHALGHDLDESLCSDTFFRPLNKPPKPIQNPPHYDWFETGPFWWGPLPLNERKVVQHYDRLRVHPKVNGPLLFALRRQLAFLAHRVAYEAITQPDPKTRKPSWGKYRRGWRFQQQIHRSQNQQFVG